MSFPTRDQVTLITSIVHGAGRNHAIRRWLDFHGGLEVAIVIVAPTGILSDIPIMPTSAVCVECENNDSVAIKLLKGLALVKTPFVCWVADDDFVLGEMLDRSVQTLTKNQNTIACDGVSFFLEEGTGRQVNRKYSVGQFWALRKVSNSDVAPNACERFINYADNFAPMVLHGVVRKDVFTQAIDLIQNLPVRWGDNVALALFLAKGNVAMLPCVSNIRSHGSRIMDRASGYYTDADIPKERLVLDKRTKEKMLSELCEGNQPSPRNYAALEYYWLRTSGALNNASALKQNGCGINRIRQAIQVAGVWLAFVLIRPRVVKEINSIKKLVRQNPLQ